MKIGADNMMVELTKISKLEHGFKSMYSVHLRGELIGYVFSNKPIRASLASKWGFSLGEGDSLFSAVEYKRRKDAIEKLLKQHVLNQDLGVG